MHREFRGDAIYQPETEVHFPHLTVGQTLLFAALAKTPQNRLPGVSREAYAAHIRDVVMAVFGISHTVNTKVGDDFVRGVSGGERKRVSIAEVALAQSPLQCWDNSTRGLDSATAVEFIKTIRLAVDIFEVAAVVSLYQAPQQAYDVCCPPLISRYNRADRANSSLTRSPYYTRAVRYTSVQWTKRKSILSRWDITVQTGKQYPTFSLR